jgi:replicative DNA helicase
MAGERPAPPPPTPLRPEEPAPRPALANTDAEQALLGAIFINNRAWERVADFLKPEHFAIGVHGRIYEAIGKLIDSGSTANPVTLKPMFDRDEALASIGGAAYLARLAYAAVTVANTEDYARAIHDLYLRRELAAIGEDVVNDAHKIEHDDPAAAQIERVEARLFELATIGQIGAGLRPLAESLAHAITKAETAYKSGTRTVGVPTGLLDLDRLLGGLHKSDLIVLAGRTAMGKSALAINIAKNAASHPADPAHVGFFSPEMSAEQLATRILAEASGISSDSIRRGELKPDDFNDFLAIGRQLADLPLWIDETPALTVAALRSRARRLKRRKGLDLIVIDYIQLLQSTRDERRRQSENRMQEISEITRGLKALAKQLDVPVLAISQLSRAVEQREDKRPLLSDLRESGSIEQDADSVMFIFREEYYLREPDPADQVRWSAWYDKISTARNKAELIVAKNRHGPVGTIYLRFDHAMTRFDNLAQKEEDS